jgi:hypothetical protein
MPTHVPSSSSVAAVVAARRSSCATTARGIRPREEREAALRYIVAWFAKDLTLSTTHPGNEPVLDQMIDVIAHAERTLVRGR